MNKSEILSAIQQYKGFKSDKAFAQALGITPQAFSKWRERNAFDFDKVHSAFPELSVEWLVTGQGDMLKSADDKVRVSPVVPDDLVRQSGTNVLDWIENNRANTEQLKVSHILPTFDFFYRAICDAMKPNIEKGDLLALKALADKTKIIDGECYVIDTRAHGLIIRRLHYRAGTYTCECNLKELGTIEINENDVFSVFSIAGLIRLRVSSHSETTRLWVASERKDRIIEHLMQQNERLLALLDSRDTYPVGGHPTPYCKDSPYRRNEP
jgi:hypothetical protein